MPMPTIPGIPPETWELLLQIIGQLNTSIVELQEQGITTFEQLRQWLMLQGYELVEISEVVGYTVCKTTAVDPTTSNAVATRVATDIATTGGAGTAVAQFTSGGNRTLGLVSKVVAVGACLSLLVSTIGAGLVTDEIKEDLITSADPFTIDGENVPVLIDENGKTHFLEEMVEAIRAKAIELGVFSNGEPVPVTGAYSWSVNGTTWYAIETRSLENLRKCNISNMPNTIITANGYAWTDNTLVYRMNYQDPPSSPKLQTQIMFRYRFETSSQRSYRAAVVGIGDDLTQTGRPYAYHYENGSLSSGYTSNWSTIYIRRESDGAVRSARMTIREDYVNNVTPVSDPLYPYANDFPLIDGNNVVNTYALYAQVLFGESGEAIEGITPSADLIAEGIADTTKPLTQVIPKLAEGEMSIASPTEDDLEHKSNWYPVSINSEDVFTDGATEEETSTAPDGDVKPDVQPSIVDAIKDLIDTLYPDGVPEVPVSDSGDTPPAEPPLISGSANGLWSIYNPTLQQVQDFGAYLWSENILDQITRMFNSPIDAVIGFHMIYCTPVKGTAKNIKCGYLDTGVSSITVANQYATIDCGTIEVPEFYHTALDYVSTKLALYLPFIGIVPLSTAVCMGSTLQVIYRIDVLTGTCLAQVKVIKENSDAVMYAFEGNCSVQIPLTATTYTGIASALINTVSAGLSVFMGDYISAAGDVGSALGAGMANLSGTKQSGQMGANAGALGIRVPYLIITHPVSYDALQYNTQYGYPLNQTISLGSVTGYTRVKDIHLAGIPCTDDELEQIESLLKDGVIIN